MLRPSYTELMEIINNNQLADSKITSRYTIVLAAAKRARQIIDGAVPLTKASTDRAVSIAIQEMSEGRITIDVEEDMLDGNYERLIKSQMKYKNITALTKDDLREDLKDKYEPVEYKDLDDDEDADDDEKGSDGFMNEVSYDDDDDDYKEKDHYMYESDDYEDEDD